MIDWGKFDYFIKALSIASGGILIAISILSWVLLTVDPTVIASRIAYVILGVKIVLSNFKLQFMRDNFPYMYIHFWNGLFVLGCGSLLIDGVFSLYFILGLVMMGLGVAIIVSGLVRPGKRDYVNS